MMLAVVMMLPDSWSGLKNQADVNDMDDPEELPV